LRYKRPELILYLKYHDAREIIPLSDGLVKGIFGLFSPTSACPELVGTNERTAKSDAMPSDFFIPYSFLI
jgi:hypothetical protein